MTDRNQRAYLTVKAVTDPHDDSLPPLVATKEGHNESDDNRDRHENDRADDHEVSARADD